MTEKDFDFGKCSVCGIYGWLNNHHCPPKWEVVEKEAFSYADEEECWCVVYALDAKEAAEKAAEQLEDAFGSPIDSQQVMVVRGRDGTLQRFIVDVDTIVVYSARREIDEVVHVDDR